MARRRSGAARRRHNAAGALLGLAALAAFAWMVWPPV